jgi:hypothetical protein
MSRKEKGVQRVSTEEASSQTLPRETPDSKYNDNKQIHPI